MEKQFEFLMYKVANEEISVNAIVKDESIWLTQKAMAELFSVNKSTISRHLKNIFDEGELNEEVVVAKIATTTHHGAIDGKVQHIRIQILTYKGSLRRFAESLLLWKIFLIQRFLIFQHIPVRIREKEGIYRESWMFHRCAFKTNDWFFLDVLVHCIHVFYGRKIKGDALTGCHGTFRTVLYESKVAASAVEPHYIAQIFIDRKF